MNLDLIFYLFLMFGGIAFVIYRKVAGKKKTCPECAAPLPKYRLPTNLREVFWGGWTCEKCGAEVKVDFSGNIT